MTTCAPSETGHPLGTRRSPSIKMAVFLEVKLFLRSPSIKMAVFLEVKLFLRLSSRKKAVFLDGRWQTKKRHPRKDVSVSGVELGGRLKNRGRP